MTRELEERYRSLPASKLKEIAASADFTEEARRVAAGLLESGEHADEEAARPEQPAPRSEPRPWTAGRVVRILAALACAGMGLLLLIDAYGSSMSMYWEEHCFVLGLGNALWLLGLWIWLRTGAGLLMALVSLCLGLATVGLAAMLLDRGRGGAVLPVIAAYLAFELAWFFVVIRMEKKTAAVGPQRR